MGLFDRFRRSPQSPEEARLGELVRNLRHSDWQVRRDAARALGELGARAESAVPALEEAIADEHGEVCLAASDALSRIRLAAN